MKPDRALWRGHRGGRWAVFFIYAGLIYLFSAMPATIGPALFPGADKIMHAGEFGLFAAILFWAIRGSFEKTRPRVLWAIVAIVSLSYGALDEFHQSLVPTREADLYDWVAEAIGIFLVLTGISLRKSQSTHTVKDRSLMGN